MHWQVQEAKQRLSELIRAVEAEGAQYVTRHGKEIAVVIDIAEYRSLTGVEVMVDFKHALTAHAEPDDELSTVLDEVVAARGHDMPREIDVW